MEPVESCNATHASLGMGKRPRAPFLDKYLPSFYFLITYLLSFVRSFCSVRSFVLLIYKYIYIYREQRDETRHRALLGAWAGAHVAWGMEPVAWAHGAYTGSNGTGRVLEPCQEPGHGRKAPGAWRLGQGRMAPTRGATGRDTCMGAWGTGACCWSLVPGRLGHGAWEPSAWAPGTWEHGA